MSKALKWFSRFIEKRAQPPAGRLSTQTSGTENLQMDFQSVLGNRGTNALLQASPVSGKAEDPLEREADAMADAALNSTDDFGEDFSGVRLHNDSRAAPALQILNARAVTVGSDIFFAPGQYRPETRQGQTLLAHELAHVIQQRRGNAPLLQCNGCDSPIEITPADRSSGTPISEASLERIESYLLEMGVRADEIGDLSTLFRFSNCSINSGIRLLEVINAGGRRRGGAGRVVRAWNRALDDLGARGEGRTGGRRNYPTIIHFALELDRLAEESMGTPYLEAIQAMPMATLAGVSVPVHPRGIYFVAAAQAGMDLAGGMQPGEGHYIAPGAFGEELTRLQAEARRIAQRPDGRRQRLNAIRRRLQYMVEIMMAQYERRELPERGYHHAEHREPALVQWFRERREAIDNLQEVVSDEQTQTAAQALLAMLDQVPRRGEIHHGFGSVDPHGTEHAMGLAIDLFNGRGSAGWFANFGIRREYWPFIYELMDRHGGGEVGLRGLRPTRIHQLTAIQARSLSQLLMSPESEALRDEIMARAVPERPRGEAAAAERRLGRKYRAIVDASRQALWQTVRRLNVLRRERHFRGEHYQDFRLEVARLHSELRLEADSLRLYSPEQIHDLLDRRAADIDNLVLDGIERVDRDQAAESPHDARFRELQSELDIAGYQVRRVRRSWRRQRRSLENLRRFHEATRRATPPEARERFGRYLRERRMRALEEYRESERNALAQLRTAQQALRRHGRLSPEARRHDADRAVLLALRDQGGRIPSISDAAAQFDDLLSDLAEFQATAHDRELRSIVERPAFGIWLEMVRERGVFDQPRVMLEGLNRVMAHEGGGAVSTHFYGGHHWEIAPPSILEDTGAYREALRRDIDSRSAEELLDIVAILEEWPGGRSALQNDSVLHSLLNEALLEKAGLMLAAISQSAALAESE